MRHLVERVVFQLMTHGAQLVVIDAVRLVFFLLHADLVLCAEQHDLLVVALADVVEHVIQQKINCPERRRDNDVEIGDELFFYAVNAFDAVDPFDADSCQRYDNLNQRILDGNGAVFRQGEMAQKPDLRRRHQQHDDERQIACP